MAAARLRRTSRTTRSRSPRPTSRPWSTPTTWSSWASSAPSGRPPWSAPGAAASPGWPSGRPGCSPTSPSRARTRSQQVTDLASEVLPRVEALQDYVWRRHLASAGARLMASDSAGSDTSQAGGGLRRHRRLHLAQQGARRRRAGRVDRVLRGRVLRPGRRPRRPGDQEHRRRGALRRRRRRATPPTRPSP